MDRIIEVKVCGNHLSKDGKRACVKGEANVTNLHITFDEGWRHYAKEITFFDAYGKNPTRVILCVQMFEGEDDYLVPIPAEPLAEAGMMTFVIDGILDNKIQRSLSDRLEVYDVPDTDGAKNAVEPTPSDLQQMQSEIEYIKGNVMRAIEAREAIEAMSATAETLSTGEDVFVEKTETNGVVNLHFGLPRGDKGDTGDSGVYIGDEEPTDPNINVWISPNGDSDYGVATISDSDIDEKIAMLTASGWQGETAPYVQEITVEGMTEETQGTVAVSESATDEQYTAATYAALRKVAQGTNSLTIKAYGEKPSVDIPLTVRMVE